MVERPGSGLSDPHPYDDIACVLGGKAPCQALIDDARLFGRDWVPAGRHQGLGAVVAWRRGFDRLSLGDWTPAAVAVSAGCGLTGTEPSTPSQKSGHITIGDKAQQTQLITSA